MRTANSLCTASGTLFDNPANCSGDDDHALSAIPDLGSGVATNSFPGAKKISRNDAARIALLVGLEIPRKSLATWRATTEQPRCRNSQRGT